MRSVSRLPSLLGTGVNQQLLGVKCHVGPDREEKLVSMKYLEVYTRNRRGARGAHVGFTRNGQNLHRRFSAKS